MFHDIQFVAVNDLEDEFMAERILRNRDMTMLQGGRINNGLPQEEGTLPFP
jgi:hypothetical protein